MDKKDSIRILFVDDEESVLNAIKRLFSRKCRHWELYFATYGGDALNILEENEMDILVSDINMPKMSGDVLIQTVLEKHPEIIRIVLSAHAESDAVARSLAVAHQFISKPFDTNDFIDMIESIVALRKELRNNQVIEKINSIEALPVMPDIYRDIMSTINNPEVSIQDIANLISKDISLSSKILQLINSAYFAISRQIESIPEAVSYLGIDVVRSLCVTTNLFEQYSAISIKRFSQKRLMEDSIRIGNVAKKIAEHITDDSAIISNAQLAGFLHCLGILILADNFPDEYEKLLLTYFDGEEKLFALEKEKFKATNCMIGAYLLQLWSIPINIIRAVAYYATPLEYLDRFDVEETFSPLAAVHVAIAVDNKMMEDTYLSDHYYCSEYLERIGIESDIMTYMELCSGFYPKKKEEDENKLPESDDKKDN